MAIWNEEKRTYCCECGCGTEINSWSTWASGHYKRSAETLQRMSESSTGRKHSEDTRQKMSESHMGHSVNEETRQVLSEALMGHEVTEETRQKISRTLTGRIVPEETCRKISETMMGRTFSTNHRKNISDSLIGRIINEEWRKNISEGVLQTYRDDPTYADRISKAQTDRFSSTEVRQEISETLRKMWSDPKYKQYMLECRRGILNSKVNKIEELLWQDIQEDLPKGWEINITTRKVIAGKVPDFINESKRQIIELFGTHWHDELYFPDKPTEEELIELYKKSGWDCIIVWEEDVRSGESVIELERFSKKNGNK